MAQELIVATKREEHHESFFTGRGWCTRATLKSVSG